jgi:hypothetical protein
MLMIALQYEFAFQQKYFGGFRFILLDSILIQTFQQIAIPSQQQQIQSQL